MADEPSSPRPTGDTGPQPATVDAVDASALQPALPDATLIECDTASAPRSAAADSKLPVRAFGDFELLEEIGRGSMGVVYRARERHSGRLVALKMMLDQPGREGGNRRRFALEARATGQLSHPGIVTIHAWGEHDGHPFYTMDHVTGTLLSRILEDGPLPCERAVRYLAAMARAVAAAHNLGIVHRDLKPGNVIIDADDQPRVLDFGLAKRLSPGSATGSATAPSTATLDSIAGVVPAELAAQQAHAAAEGSGEDRGTEQGAVLGTPAYMAPEQAVGDHRKVGPTTDVHALGAIFYEMLTGRPPFQAGTILEVLKKVAEREPPPLRSWGLRVPPVLEAVCVRAMRKDPQDRYANARLLADDLESGWQQSSLGPRFARLTGCAILALTLIATLWLAIHGWGLGSLAALFAETVPTSVAVILLDATIFVGGGLLSFGAALTWLRAWTQHSDRPAWIAATTVGLTAAAWGALVAWSAWLLVPDREVAVALGLALASALSLAAMVAVGAWYSRWSHERDRRADSPASGPFLQRLIAASAQARRTIEARQDDVARVSRPVHVALADFELARVVHRWPSGRVQRGRQRSLHRSVLIWIETAAAEGDQPQHGVLVRHPDLLGLYAVGAGPEGRFLVTEPSSASPLADFLERSPLTPLQAVRLAATMARVIECYHEHGACHGRLSADWILIRADLEPVLCPCGAPCRSDEDRARDIRALGQLLLDVLPDPPRRGQQVIRHIAAAARRGEYARAIDLAKDLDRAARTITKRWHGHVITAVLAAFVILPWLALATFGDDFAPLLGVALAPGCVLLGYSQARTLVARHRLQRRLVRPRDLVTALVPVLVFTLPAALLATHGDALSSTLATADLLGCWLAGTFVAILVTAAEEIVSTVQSGWTVATRV
jgi:serine/threonine-protein kinase